MVIPSEEFLVPIGKAQVVREGIHLSLISFSRMLYFCQEVAAEYAKKGIEIEVIDLRTIKPLDMGTIAESVRKTHFCVLVEEGHLFAGIASEVGFQIQEQCFDFLDAPVNRVCQRETPLPYSKEIERASQPNPERIRAAIEETLHL